MNTRKIFLALVPAVLCLTTAQGQRIVHQMLSNAAAATATPNTTLFYVLGSACAGCGALQGDQTGTTIYPGFPTPGSDTCFTIGVAVEETQDECGTYYQFYYTGNADEQVVSFEWDFGPNAYPQTSSVANPENVAFDSPGTYQVHLRMSDGHGCTKEYAFEVEATATAFAVNPVITHVNCHGEATGEVELEMLGGTAPFDFQWSNGGQTIFMEALPAGTYEFTVTDAEGCTYSNVAVVEQPDAPLQIAISTTDETCVDAADGLLAAYVSGGTPPYRYAWNTGDTTAQVTDLPSGEYFLTVTDARACVATRSVFLGQECNPRAVDVITPNGDGINDVWVVDNLDNFPDNEVRIYNRWGQLVYARKGYTNDWNGMGLNGKMLPAGPYYYVLRIYGDTFGLPPVRTGSISLIR